MKDYLKQLLVTRRRFLQGATVAAAAVVLPAVLPFGLVEADLERLEPGRRISIGPADTLVCLAKGRGRVEAFTYLDDDGPRDDVPLFIFEMDGSADRSWVVSGVRGVEIVAGPGITQILTRIHRVTLEVGSTWEETI